MLCFPIYAGAAVAIIAITAAAQDYANCSRLFECGRVRIGYPFSGLNRPAYCGRPAFNLNCSGGIVPTIAISGQRHKILDIDEPSRTLTVLRSDYRGILCSDDDPGNATVDPVPFDFTPDTQFLAVYRGCPPPEYGTQLPASLGELNCGRDGREGYYLLSEDMLGGFEGSVRKLLGSCVNRVMVPVNRTKLERSPPASAKRLPAAIYQGYGLRWTGGYVSACAECVKSGGECGSNETASGSFACYCSGEAYAAGCLVGGSGLPPGNAFDKTEAKKRVLLRILLPIAAIITLSLTAIAMFHHFRSRGLKKQSSKNLSLLPKPPEFNKLQSSKLSPFNVESPPNLQSFTFSEIKAATNDFSTDNLLGSGGFGHVYKCVFPGGEEMAVKRLSKSSTQGLLEFTNEVSLTVRLQHVNLVRVVGFCTEYEEKMLVYEFMANRSLDIYLFDPVKKLSLDWNTRVRIIEGVTQGLLYLQEYSNFTIIHRDIKANNVLLDDGMNPKISDFGIAKLFGKDLDEANTNTIVGTYGYVPPEYVKHGIYSMKYDVYSFGVLLLQIISGKRTQCYYGTEEDMHLLDHAYDSWRRGEGMEFCDPLLDDSSSQCKMINCLQVALLCIQEDPDDRPTMLEVSSILKNGARRMDVPKVPAFSVRREMMSAMNSRCQQEMFTYNISDISSVEPR
ncbi:unnamed protein product [Linum tenue]|uniref:non-specific serine/threonine protein kinase n=1 Tax=Linum tenue TaxID=586396 RepID=A0AAV0HX55_9ROSI|nr:unnamed protein product [Linum tenue]